MIELRSDTFTLPTAEMLDAIVTAPLGDDGYREDPTVRKLEEIAARKLDKEAACFMPSGTMANLASILTHSRGPGSVVLVGDRSDIYAYEDATIATNAGILYRALPTEPNGTLALNAIETELDKTSPHTPAALLCVETPHNLCGGVVLRLDYLQEASSLAHSRGAAVHLDGARLFNAAVALGIAPAEIVRSVDSVQFCLSKGLSAPVGSVAAGTAVFVEKLRQKRKMLGGNMRQAGILAAAGIVALERMIERLQEDHRLARRLAAGLATLPQIGVDLKTVQTNTVVFRVLDGRFNEQSFIRAACARGLHLSDFKFGRIRAVIHSGITAEDIDRTLHIIGELLQTAPAGDQAVSCTIAKG
jgi:threonine aldolase